MDIEELRKKRQEVTNSSEKTIINMDLIINESVRVAEVAHNSREILDNLEAEFEKQTGLNKLDIFFLFFTTALQCARQYILSNVNDTLKVYHFNTE